MSSTLKDLAKRIRKLQVQAAALREQGECWQGVRLEWSHAGGNASATAQTQRLYARLRAGRNGVLPNGKHSQYVPLAEVDRYTAAIARGRELAQVERQIERLTQQLQRMQAQARRLGVPVKNLLGDRDATCEWYTPECYIELARQVLGAIDLDPASNELAQSWIAAGQYYTAVDDGLKQPWFGRVWCNPPYGTPTTRRAAQLFVERAITSYQAGKITAAVLLLNRTGAGWYIDVKQQVTAVCEVRQRIAFKDAAGQVQNSPRYYNDFLYLGPQPELFRAVFVALGQVTLVAAPYPRQVGA